ncbi:MAG: hypothetical protein ABIJ39_13650 [Chloroflexota bacterium]
MGASLRYHLCRGIPGWVKVYCRTDEYVFYENFEIPDVTGVMVPILIQPTAIPYKYTLFIALALVRSSQPGLAAGGWLVVCTPGRRPNPGGVAKKIGS